LTKFDEIQVKRLDLGQDTMERCTVQVTDKHGFCAFVPGPQRWKSRQRRGAELPFDPDGVRRESRLHGAMVGRRQVNPPRRDLVIVRLASARRK
jgi:hypothetical protein